MNYSRTLAVVLAVILFSPLQQANALPDCDAWLNNQVPVGPGKFLTPTPGRLVTADMELVKAAGVTIDPSRRMRAKDYPWEHDIQIALPPSYGKTDQRFPVLWVTDGSLLFQLATALVASCAHQHIPEMIVVGIGPEDACLSLAEALLPRLRGGRPWECHTTAPRLGSAFGMGRHLVTMPT